LAYSGPDLHSGPADPDMYISTEYDAQLYFFARTFQFTFQNIENYDTYDAGKKDKTM
jgi:hypothetical protein